MNELDDNSIITFGKYKGEKLANIPANYFLWMDQQPWCTQQFKAYIKENMDVFKMELKNEI